jgi:hypothetical protein
MVHQIGGERREFERIVGPAEFEGYITTLHITNFA